MALERNMRWPRTLAIFALIGGLLSPACSSRDDDQVAPAMQPQPQRPPAAKPAAVLLPGAVTFARTASGVDVLIDSKPFTSLIVDDSHKPSLYPLFAPGGQRVTRGFPLDPRENEEHDHPHHTSLWFAHGDVNGNDFWTGDKGARIVAAGPDAITIDDRAHSIAATFEWRDPAGHPVVIEKRTMTFRGDAAARTIDFDFTLTAGDAPVTFGDTKEGTFGVRLAPTLRLKGAVAKGAIVNSAGQRDDACWGKRAAWVDYSGPIDGRTLGVAIFDHPANFRHPTWWHARDYGLFAANPFGAHDFEHKPPGTGDKKLGAGESLRFRYRLLIHDGKWSTKQLDDACSAYAAGSTPAPGAD
jgi:hypothetical protein